MTEMEVLDMIAREFRAAGLDSPIKHLPNSREMVAWRRAARRIASECDTENRRAARTASMAGAIITRGRTRL